MSLDGAYAIGLMLLSNMALAAAVLTWLRLGPGSSDAGS